MKFIAILTLTHLLTPHRHAMALVVALLFANVAIADAMCGSAKQSYIDKLTNRPKTYSLKLAPGGRNCPVLHSL